ncbi:MAG: hypothetical protein ACKOA8_05285, partial [Deltaproteobacteria bacterium]
MIFQALQILTRDPLLITTNSDYVEYVRLSKNFFYEAKTNGVCIDRINRLLPLLICYLWGVLSGSQLNDLYVLDFFLWGNLVCVLVSVFIFYRLSQHLNLSDSTRLVGFFLLFINFIVARHFFINPILTDSTALMMAWVTTY